MKIIEVSSSHGRRAFRKLARTCQDTLVTPGKLAHWSQKRRRHKIVTLKVSKFPKQIFLFSFEPKNKQNYFLNSALASKMSQIKKMKALYFIGILFRGYSIQ